MKLLHHSIPNLLSYSRALSGAIVLYTVISLNNHRFAGLTLLILLYAAISDFLDGYYARRFRVESAQGKIIDPIADKCIILSVFTAFYILELMPLWILGTIIFREIFITVLRLFWARQGCIIAAEWSGKVKTFIQFIYAITAVSGVFCFNIQMVKNNLLISGLMHAAWLLTIYSGVEFFYRNRSLFTNRSNI